MRNNIFACFDSMGPLIDVIENHVYIFCLLACYCCRCLYWKKKLILAWTLWKHLLIYICIQTLDTDVLFDTVLLLSVRPFSLYLCSHGKLTHLHSYRKLALNHTSYVLLSFLFSLCLSLSLSLCHSFTFSHTRWFARPIDRMPSLSWPVYFVRAHKRLLIYIKFLSDVGLHYSQCELFHPC